VANPPLELLKPALKAAHRTRQSLASRWCEVPQPDDIAFVPTTLYLCLPALLGSLRIVREAERPIVQRR
jgi:hypothetical protein